MIPHRHTSSVISAGVLVALWIVGGLAFDHFASLHVARNLLVDNAFLGVAAIGATIVLVSGGIDLSIGSLMALAGVVAASLIERGGAHPAAAVGVALTMGVGLGACQGVLIQTLRLPAFLVTLAGLFLFRGLAFAVESQSLNIRHPFITDTVANDWVIMVPGRPELGVPFPVIVLVGIVALAWLLLSRSRAGRYVHAVGDDEHAAELMGVPVPGVRIGVYAASGGLSALAGVLFLLYQQAGDPAGCRGSELDAIAAAVIGGTLLRGGVGSAPGTLVGVLILGVIQTLISFHGDLSSWWARIASAGLLLAFVMVQQTGEIRLRGGRADAKTPDRTARGA